MSKSSVQEWCSDKLHELIGYTDSAMASYLVSVARKSTTADDILQVLEKGGVQASKSLQQDFANELYHIVAPLRKEKQRNNVATNADWIKSAARYKLVDDPILEPVKGTKRKEGETATRAEQSSRSESRSKSKSSKSTKSSDRESDRDTSRREGKDERKTRKRRYREASSDEDSNSRGEGPDQYRRRHEDKYYERARNREKESNEEKEPGAAVFKQESALTEEERTELDREKDKTERDEFVQRMLDRDKNKTKGESKEDKEEAAHNKRIAIERQLLKGENFVDEETGVELTLDKLREESRRAYLIKREERELTLLKQSLEDEATLFRDSKLTAAERKKIELGKKILSMVEERDGKDEKDDGFYRLPDEYDENLPKNKQNESLLSSRYTESKHEKTEQELWEESQTNKAVGLAGKKKKDNDADKYDLVFEERIDFVMQETTKGYDRRDKSHKTDLDLELKRQEDPLEAQPATEHEKILAGRKNLPVYPYREALLAAVKDHQILILVGETGSGKTTQIPQYLHEIGYCELGKVGCTQPRRVAAMSVAARVAQEMNVRLGHEVGYSIRFENCTSQKTVIQYMTDGMLLREILTQPDLESYSCMVIDEAHERTLHTDVLFGLIKDIVRFRKDLKLIISSATLDAEKFSKYFDDASIFMIPGRMFPVDIYYTKAPEADYVDAAVVTCLQIHISQPLNGDVLIFLTGQEEIETAAEILTQRSRNLGNRIPELIICPIFANMPSDQQAKIFEKTPKRARKVVIATNIAETSLTINGICYVIDSGFNKQKTYNARSGMESLVVTPVSQAAANQRAGRAGRTQPGKCFRLFTAWSFQNELEANTVPEILRTNMGNVVLMLKSLGINDLMGFDFLDKPPASALIKALEQLYALGALNDRGELTKLGRRMAEFPLDPMLSKAVIASEKYKCTAEVLSTVAMLSLGASVFYRPKEKAVHADTARLNFARDGGGDHISLLRCYTEWAETDYSSAFCFENFVQVKSMKKARDIREQLEALCERVEIDQHVSSPDDMNVTLKAMTAGFFYNVAKLGKSGEYHTVKQRKTVYIHPSSVMAKEEDPPPWLLFFELAFTTKEFMRQVAPIKPGWLIEIAPHYYQENEVEDTKAKKMPKMRK